MAKKGLGEARQILAFLSNTLEGHQRVNDEGNVTIAWATNTESGFDFQTYGINRRVPIDCDGLRLVSLLPPDLEERKNAL